MDLRKRFYVAMGIYAALGLVIWFAIDGTTRLYVGAFVPVRLPEDLGTVAVTVRQLALAIWAMFVVRTVLHWRAEQVRAEREQQEQSEGVN